jgi:hypothetical protein
VPKPIVAAVVLAALGALSLPSSAAEVEAIQNATVQPGGVRTGGSGINFFNIEGSSFGSFSSFGVARFDISSVRAAFDGQYGAGQWKVASVTLRLTQANASFTADGGVGIYFTGDDSVSLVSPSPLQYQPPGGPFLVHNPTGQFRDLRLLQTYAFQQVSSGTVEEHLLYPVSRLPVLSPCPVIVACPPDSLAEDIRTDDTVTLVLRELGPVNPGVAATYAGYNNATYAGPTLVILAAPVPEPETYALLGAGLLLLGARAVRRGGR